MGLNSRLLNPLWSLNVCVLMYAPCITKLKNINTWAGGLVHWLWEETRVSKVVGLNPGTVYWMDIFSHIFVVKIVMMFV